MSVQLDGNGNWGGWNYNLGYTNFQLLKAFVGSWNDVQVLGANNGYWSVKVTGLSNVTVNMTMIIAYAPNP